LTAPGSSIIFTARDGGASLPGYGKYTFQALRAITTSRSFARSRIPDASGGAVRRESHLKEGVIYHLY
jgi:hypothetical protein